jgi:hypothetical protein
MLYFQTKKPNLGKFLEGLAIEDVDIFFGHLVNFLAIWYILMAIWFILWSFDIFYGHLVYVVHI